VEVYYWRFYYYSRLHLHPTLAPLPPNPTASLSFRIPTHHILHPSPTPRLGRGLPPRSPRTHGARPALHSPRLSTYLSYILLLSAPRPFPHAHARAGSRWDGWLGGGIPCVFSMTTTPPRAALCITTITMHHRSTFLGLGFLVVGFLFFYFIIPPLIYLSYSRRLTFLFHVAVYS